MHHTHTSAFELSWELLDRYYAGELTGEERERVESYLATHTDSSKVVIQVAAEIRGSASPQDATQDATQAPDVSGMLAALHERMQPKIALKRLVHTCFGGSVERAVAALLDVDDTELTEEEINRLRQAIEATKQEGR